VLLRPRERELLGDDALREHEPRMVIASLPQISECAECVEAREERGREAIPDRVEPDGRWPRKNPNPVTAPDWIPIVDALDVMPHPVGVDEPRACLLRDREHAAVD